MSDSEVAVIGAGPYGLAIAAALRQSGVDHRVIGDPMSFWRQMPKNEFLRSNWTATSIADRRGPVSLGAYQRATGQQFGKPMPIESFVAYGEWVQGHAAPDVDRRSVAKVERDSAGFRLQLDDGDHLLASRVVVAAGIAPFARCPAMFAELPTELATHSSEHHDLSRFAGRRVVVVGAGQSALETAALLHEGGAEVEVHVRRDHVNWLRGGKYQRMLGRCAPLLYAPTDVGPMGISRVVAVPDLFRRLPRAVQDKASDRAIRPAGAEWLIDRLRDVPIHLSREVSRVERVEDRLRIESASGATVIADHLIYATGYQVDIGRYPFMPPDLVSQIERVGGYPVLRRGLESSVPRLHFVGAPAAWSFGPINRFVSGSWFASRAVLRAVLADRAASPAKRPNATGTALGAKK